MRNSEESIANHNKRVNASAYTIVKIKINLLTKHGSYSIYNGLICSCIIYVDFTFTGHATSIE